MRFTITEIPLHASRRSVVHWQLHDGPATESGFANSIPLALVAITRARRRLTGDEHRHPDPMPGAPSHPRHDPAPTRLQTPYGNFLPAQQDVPSGSHGTSPSSL